MTPVKDRLALHGVMRGWVMGQYGEGSLDVHSLGEASARESRGVLSRLAATRIVHVQGWRKRSVHQKILLLHLFCNR